MVDPVAILVCGNAGPVGGELLQRKDIQSYWALSADEAKAVLKVVAPRVAIVRGPMIREVLQARNTAHVVLLLEDNEWDQTAQLFEHGANALVGASAGERILEAVSELTGLAFARYPRVQFETSVQLVSEDRSTTVKSVNVSASGIAVKSPETLPMRATVKVTFTDLAPPLSVSALVVRAYELDGAHVFGLCFINLDDPTRARLVALVDGELERNPDTALTIDVPELSTAAKLDGGDLPPGVNALDELKARLRDVASEARREVDRERRPSSKGEDAISGLARKLTAAEHASVAGKDAPAWAETAVRARLQLHLDRRHLGRPAAKTVEEALVLCRTMGSGATDERTRADACATRAALLREIYSEPWRARHGTHPRKP